MSTNISTKLSQGALASVALLSLMLITGVTISALNPIVEQSSSNITSGTVKGISSDQEALPLDLSLNVIEGTEFRINMLSTHNQNDKALGTVIVSKDNLIKGSYSESLVKVYNPNIQTAKAKVSFYLPEELKGNLKVYLEDEKDSLIMYTIEESYGSKTITIPELSERNFSIRLEAEEDINTKFELVFVFTVGQ